MLILLVVVFMLLVMLLVVLSCPLCHKEKFSNPVDIVYTWVDTNDPEWRKEYDKYNPKKNNNNKRLVNTDNSWDELKLSIGLVRRNLPWVNNIYVITQRPQTVPEDIIQRYDVRVVHHDQLGLNHQTFNSTGIETKLANIPGLSERFIYFNDDMYVTRRLNREEFFTEDGRPLIDVDINKSRKLNNGESLDADNNYVRNLYKCSQILRAKGILFSCPTHHPTPMTKTIFNEARKLFERYWERTDASVTRKKVNILPIYLAASVGIRNGSAVQNKKRLKRFYSENELPRGEYDLVCINSITPDTFKEFSSSVSF